MKELKNNIWMKLKIYKKNTEKHLKNSKLLSMHNK